MGSIHGALGGARLGDAHSTAQPRLTTQCALCKQRGVPCSGRVVRSITIGLTCLCLGALGAVRVGFDVPRSVRSFTRKTRGRAARGAGGGRASWQLRLAVSRRRRALLFRNRNGFSRRHVRAQTRDCSEGETCYSRTRVLQEGESANSRTDAPSTRPVAVRGGFISM